LKELLKDEKMAVKSVAELAELLEPAKAENLDFV